MLGKVTGGVTRDGWARAPLVGALLVGLAASLLVFFGAASAALAHEEPALIDPAEGLRLTEPPERVMILYEEQVEEPLLRVYGEGGERVDEGDARLGGPIEDPGLDVDHEAALTVGLEELPPGAYTVEYRVTGTDGHTVGDSYVFGVLGSGGREPAVPAREGNADHGGQEPREVPETGGLAPGALLAALLALSGATAWGAARLVGRPRS